MSDMLPRLSIKPQRTGRIVRPSVRLSVCPAVIESFPGCIFVTDGLEYLGIGSYKRPLPVDVPFDNKYHKTISR